MQRKLLPLLLLLVTFFNIYAQPNYTSANFGVAGDSLFYTKVLLDTNYGYNFAHAGNNINWNFSSFTPYSQFNFDFLSPVTAGYRNAFIAKCVGSGGTGAACNTQFNTLTNVAFRSLDSIKISGYTFDNLVAHDFKTNRSEERRVGKEC